MHLAEQLTDLKGDSNISKAKELDKKSNKNSN